MTRADEYEDIAELLDALSHPARIAVLAELRSPRLLSEIEVAHAPWDAEEARVLARQTIQRHLGKLVDAGLVQSGPTEREFGETTQYIVDHQALFALAEEIRELARLTPEQEPSNPTETVDPPTAGPEPGEPCLLLVKGVPEGRRFPLPRGSGPREWVLGRRRDVEVALDFDPYVSTRNSAIRLEDGSFSIVDLPESRNGTRVNMEPLRAEQPRPLSHGDLVGVGRTILSFRDPRVGP